MYISRKKSYPLVNLGAIRHVELPFSNILRLPFEFVSAVGRAVKRVIRVRVYSRDTISLGVERLERESLILLSC